MSASIEHVDGFTTESKRLLDPVDRISEVLFGLLMAVTIVGSLSIASTEREEVRTVMIGALGCNLAWGLVDAVMFLVRRLTEKTRRFTLEQHIRGASSATAQRIIALALPAELAALLGTDELEAMRVRLSAQPASGRPRLVFEDWLSGIGVFVLVVVATFPVVLPFLFTSDLNTAMKASRVITLVMLYGAGHGFGRYAGHKRPVMTGFLMALLGAALIAAIMALGG